MSKEIKDIKRKIIRSLYSYTKNKHMLENTRTYLQLYDELHNLLQNYMQIRREMLDAIASINGIDSALLELLPEVREYARIKYFQPNHYTVDGLAMQLNVNRRTVHRWDELLIATVAKYYNP